MPYSHANHPYLISSCCPYGALHAVPAVFCGVAMLTTWVYTLDCNFFRARIYDNRTETIGIGFFSTEGEDSDDTSSTECVDYPGELDADAPLQFGRTMAVFASVIGFISFVLILIPACWNPGQLPYMKTLAVTYFCLSVTALFSLVCFHIFCGSFTDVVGIEHLLTGNELTGCFKVGCLSGCT